MLNFFAMFVSSIAALKENGQAHEINLKKERNLRKIFNNIVSVI